MSLFGESLIVILGFTAMFSLALALGYSVMVGVRVSGGRRWLEIGTMGLNTGRIIHTIGIWVNLSMLLILVEAFARHFVNGRRDGNNGMRNRLYGALTPLTYRECERFDLQGSSSV